MSKIKGILSFINETEGLKKLMRHSWLSNGRRESVAEHTWRMAMMALILAQKLQRKVDIGHTLQIIIIHDLPEIYAGDRVAWKKIKDDKHQEEKKGLQKIIKTLPTKTQKMIMNLWLEYEENKTSEANLAHAVDKLEVIIQHNQANIKTWAKSEKEFTLHYGDEFCNYDKTIRTLKNLARLDTAKKIK